MSRLRIRVSNEKKADEAWAEAVKISQALKRFDSSVPKIAIDYWTKRYRALKRAFCNFYGFKPSLNW